MININDYINVPFRSVETDYLILKSKVGYRALRSNSRYLSIDSILTDSTLKQYIYSKKNIKKKNVSINSRRFFVKFAFGELDVES